MAVSFLYTRFGTVIRRFLEVGGAEPLRSPFRVPALAKCQRICVYRTENSCAHGKHKVQSPTKQLPGNTMEGLRGPSIRNWAEQSRGHLRSWPFATARVLRPLGVQAHAPTSRAGSSFLMMERNRARVRNRCAWWSLTSLVRRSGHSAQAASRVEPRQPRRPSSKRYIPVHCR